MMTEKCRWDLVEQYLFDVHHTQCGEESYIGKPLKETKDSPKYIYCPFCGKEIEEYCKAIGEKRHD